MNVLEPLAFRIRPNNLDEVMGQEALVGPNGFLRKSVEKKALFSLILFGNPGTGKTTIAEAYAKTLKVHFVSLNAVTTSKKEMEAAVEEAKYIALNRAIRSRCRLLEVKPLTDEEVVKGLRRAIEIEKGLNKTSEFEDEALRFIAKLAGGDMRFALNILEEAAVQFGKGPISKEDVASIEMVPNFAMDKDEEEHYDSVSALQKSIRGKDVDAALYYLARLCIAGDLDSISRRMLVCAYEDIGLGNPNAVMRCQMAIEAAERIGFPEAVIPLGVAVIDLCLSPHSRSGDESIQSAMAFAKEQPFMVQDYLKLTPVNMREEDKYPYDRPDLWERIQYLPDFIKTMRFYKPQESSQYEKILNENYRRLIKQGRSNDLAALKKK